MTDVKLRELSLEEVADHFASWLNQIHRGQRRRLFVPLLRELATGQPVDPERLAGLAGVSPENTIAALREAAEWDANGTRVVGFALTSIPTPHRVEFHGRTMWAWCAPDAIGIPWLIGAAVRIQSSCAATGDQVRVEVTPTSVERVEPAGAVISFFLPSPDQPDLRQAACGNANFYRDAEVASKWLAAYPTGRLLPVADAFQVFGNAARQVWPELRTLSSTGPRSSTGARPAAEGGR
jgi:alkylmercury lyase